MVGQGKLLINQSCLNIEKVLPKTVILLQMEKKKAEAKVRQQNQNFAARRSDPLWNCSLFFFLSLSVHKSLSAGVSHSL